MTDTAPPVSAADDPSTTSDVQSSIDTVKPKRPLFRRPFTWILAAVAIVVIASVVVALILAAAPKSFTLKGDMLLTGDNVPVGEACAGTSGYDDMDEGAQVIVTDASGKTIAVGALAAGQVIETSCNFPFIIKDVPAGEKFYKVEVSHRGAVQYTEKEMRKGIVLSLGS